jgi:hypothetical protein
MGQGLMLSALNEDAEECRACFLQPSRKGTTLIVRRQVGPIGAVVGDTADRVDHLPVAEVLRSAAPPFQAEPVREAVTRQGWRGGLPAHGHKRLRQQDIPVIGLLAPPSYQEALLSCAGPCAITRSGTLSGQAGPVIGKRMASKRQLAQRHEVGCL